MKKLILMTILMLGTLLNYSYAEDKPRAVIIFDASGSMWGQINGITKLEIARDALKNVVTEWNPSVELGLTVYGHRKKGDCNDIETVIPAGKVDKDKVISTVMAIKPKGKTPISRSLRKVADELKYTEEKATIILISDGKETCDPDPCAAAKALEEKGIDFITHVIGFNVDKKTDKQLECIAHATGGEYFSAKNAAGLNKAMKTIAKKVEVFVPPKPVVKKLTHNLEITASETKGGKLVEASYDIYKQDDEGKVGERMTSTTSTSKKEAVSNKLPVGKYIIDSSYNAYEKKIPFEIKADKITELDVVFGQTGKVYITARETEGGKLIGSSCRIYNEDKSDWFGLSAYKKDPKKHTRQLPIGKYTVNCSYNEFKKEDIPLEIKAGETVHLDVVFNAFMLGAKCPNIDEKVSYEVYASSGELVYDKITSCSKVLKLILDDDKYSVEAKIASGKGEVSFDVGAGKPKKLILDLTNLNHEEEIKADSEVAVVVPVTPKKVEAKTDKNSPTVHIGNKTIEIEGISKKDQADLKKAAKMLEMLGGLMGGAQTKEQKEAKKQKEIKQKVENEKADKEFEEMSKNLDMFTK